MVVVFQSNLLGKANKLMQTVLFQLFSLVSNVSYHILQGIQISSIGLFKILL